MVSFPESGRASIRLLGLGFEYGPQRIRDLAIARPLSVGCAVLVLLGSEKTVSFVKFLFQFEFLPHFCE